jgi:hypothetical protein
MTATGTGTAEDPWVLHTPPGTSEYTMYRDDAADPPELVCQVGSTKLRYQARCLEDAPAMLRDRGDWMELGSADENKAAKDDTLEAWARSSSNRSAGGTACARAIAAASPCTCHHSSSASASSSWSTTPATTESAPAEVLTKNSVRWRTRKPQRIWLHQLGRVDRAAISGRRQRDMAADRPSRSRT